VTHVDLRTLRIRSGEQFHDTPDVELDPLELGADRVLQRFGERAHLDAALVTARRVERLQRASLRVAAWTVNDVSEASRLESELPLRLSSEFVSSEPRVTFEASVPCVWSTPSVVFAVASVPRVFWLRLSSVPRVWSTPSVVPVVASVPRVSPAAVLVAVSSPSVPVS